MSELFLSKPTTNRWPNPLGRRIKISALLSGLGADAIVDSQNPGVLGNSASTLGAWANLDAKSLTSLGYLANLPPSGLVTNAVLLTNHAPITKGYGDAQLADASDVEVLVDGNPATIVAIDPVVGVLVLDQEVVEGAEVAVSYHYTPNPTLEMNSLNSGSYLLNQWRDRGQVPFTYNTVLGPYNRPQPTQYEHRYRAFDYPYTSVLNDPTSMTLNEPKNRLTLPKFNRRNQDASVFFEGDQHPQDFEFIGPSLGTATFDNGLYVIEDNSSSVNVIDSQSAFFQRDVDITFDHASIFNFRMQLDTWTNNGDFTGVAAGYSDDSHMYFVGFLDIGGFKAVGFLKDPHDESDWQSYAGIEAQAVERDDGGTPVIDLLVFDDQPPLSVGQRIFSDGSIYEILDIDESQTTPGVWEVFVDAAFPSEGSIELFPETDWTELKTYRVFKTEDNEINMLVGGNILPIAKLSQSAAAVAPEIFDVVENNSLFFGSVDRKSTARSLWDFVRYSILPSSDIQQTSRVDVNAEFNDLPEDDPNNPWYLTDNQGYSKIFANEFLLTQSAGRAAVGGAVNYTRIEPFLTSKAIVNFRTSLRVHSYATGHPAFMTIADDKKEVTLAFFDEKADQVFTDPSTLSLLTKGHWSQANSASLQTRGQIDGLNDIGPDQFLAPYGGVQTFDDAGWSDTLDDAELTFFDHFMRVQHDGVASEATLESSGAGTFDDVVFGAYLRFGDYTIDMNNRVPVYFGNSDGNDHVYLMPYEDTTRYLVFTDQNGNVVTSGGNPLGFEFDWADDDFHHFRVTRYSGNVTVFIDGEYQAVFDIADLPDDTGSDPVTRFAFLDGQVDVDVDFFFAHSAVHEPRRIGVYQGGDLLDANNYDFVSKEWLGTFVDIEIRRDPTGKTQIFLDDVTNPAFEYQYDELPDRVSDRFNTNTELGYVQFGTNDPQAYSEVLWDYVRYDVINQREVQKANNGSYLNRHNVISSPEPIIDEDPETVLVESDTSNLIHLSKTEMYARSILSVTSEDGTTTYPFAYDEETNTIAVTGSGLPSENETVQVVFYHREPYTEAYLENNWAFTRLNEDTPPVPLSQTVDLQAEESFSSVLNDPEDVLNVDADFTFNDGKRTVRFTTNDEAYYECLKMLTTEDAGQDHLISSACDENGLREITFGGPFANDEYDLPDQGDEDTRHRYGIGYFNNPPDTFNDIETNTAGIESPVSISYALDAEDVYGGANDEALTGASEAILEDFYGSSTFNNPKSTMSRIATDPGAVHPDSVIATANTITQTDYLIDYTTSILYP